MIVAGSNGAILGQEVGTTEVEAVASALILHLHFYLLVLLQLDICLLVSQEVGVGRASSLLDALHDISLFLGQLYP